MTVDRPTLLRYGWRVLLIAVLGAGILIFGYRHGRAWRPSPTAPRAGPARVQAQLAFEPLAGSKLLGAYRCVFNGEEAEFARYRSAHPARKVVDQFEARYGRAAAQAKPAEGTMVRVAAGAYAAAGAIDPEGRTLGIVAFEEPKTGGSTYFVGRSRSPRAGWRHGDAPGEEVAGIPRPLRSRRIFCIDGLGGIPSRLLVYEGSGAISDTAALFATEMPKAGWERNRDVERAIQQRLEGRFLSFLNGTQRAMIYIERDPGTGTVRTAVAYSVKSWLPPDRGV
jgi:hypothetical protein